MLETGAAAPLDLLRAALEAMGATRDGAPAFDDACPWLFLFHRRCRPGVTAVDLVRSLFGPASLL